MKYILIAFALVLMLSCSETKLSRTYNFPKTVEEVEHIPVKNEVWVFILAGQSNMAGRAFVSPKDTIANNRIFTLNQNGKIVYAKEPLHFYDPTKTGLDCGLSFANHLIQKIPVNISILLIPTAVGGSSISQWIGDSVHRKVKLLTNFTERVRIGSQYGTIKGILWHQGETDANNNESQLYSKRLSILCKQFRDITGNDTLPILLGELGIYSKNPEQWKKINESIRDYHLLDENTDIIKTSDLKQMGDFEHFNARSVRILGKRYAKSMQLKLKEIPKSNRS